MRRAAGDRYLTLFGALFLSLTAAFLLAAGILTLRQMTGVALFIFAVGLFQVLMVAVVTREALDRWRTRIRLEPDQVRLDLPQYLNRPPVKTAVPLADIAEIDWRGESFNSFGMAAMHEAYALKLKSGQWLILGGDKAMTQPFFAKAARAISERSGAPIRDIGMVDGKPGLLQVTGMSAPEWSARSLPPDKVAKRIRAVQMTWLIVGSVTWVAFIAQFIASFF